MPLAARAALSHHSLQVQLFLLLKSFWFYLLCSSSLADCCKTCALYRINQNQIFMSMLQGKVRQRRQRLRKS